MARAAASGKHKQLNVRIDEELLERFRDYCGKEGLDPHQLVINFIQRAVDEQVPFQDRLWQQMLKNAERP